MTRAAWLAVGAAVGALTLEALGPIAAGVGGLAIALPALVVRGVLDAGRWPDRRRRWLAAAAPFGLGLCLVAARGAAVPGQTASLDQVPGGHGPWHGTVVSVGAPKDGSRPTVVVLDGVPDAVDRIRVAATLPWYPVVVPGDAVVIEGGLRAPPTGEYGDYLRRLGVGATVRANSLELDRSSGTGGDPWEGFRRSASAGLDEALPEPESGLAAGILVGLRDRVDRDLSAAFTTAGVSHIVAISGWNIAIVATTIGALVGRIGRRRRAIVTALAILLYVAFVGPSASVVRAAAMAGCALLARELGRPATAGSAMGLAVVGLLLVDPAYIDDAGFRLSVLATAGLIAWGTQLSERLAGDRPSRLRRWLAESLGVSLAAQAATLPVILLDFGRLSLVSPAVNLVVAPLVAPAMGAGALALAVGLLATAVPAVSGLAVVAGLPAWALLAALIGVVRTGAGVPFASLQLGPPWDGVGALVALIVVALGPGAWRRVREARNSARGQVHATVAGPSRVRPPASSHGRHSLRLVGGALGAAVIGLGLVVAHRPSGAARITVLDVGQGDAILVEGGRGGRLLIDGGPDPGRLLVTLDERLPPWDRRIDAIVLTHPHEDHVAGLALLLDRYRVGRVFEPGMHGPGPGYRAWDDELGRAGAPSRWALGTGDRLAVDDIDLRVLWPDPGTVPDRPPDTGTAINNVSIVFLGEVEGHRFLLAGDIEQGIDPVVLGRGLPQVDFLKVAHHGSKTASTEALLEAVRPGVAVVSAGAGNPYGHPAPATIDRLRANAGQVYRTDLDGSVAVTFDGPAMHAVASGGRRVSEGGARAAAAAGSRFACAVDPSLPGRPPAIAVLAAGVVGRRLPHPAAGGHRGLLYDRPDPGHPPGDLDAGLPDSQRAAGLLLGRRRLWSGGGGGCHAPRSRPLSRRRARALAPRPRSREPAIGSRRAR